MRIRFATSDEEKLWDHLIQSNPDGGSVFSSTILANLKRTHGWTPRFVIIERTDQLIAVTVLEKTIPLLGRLWYAIKGPGMSSTNDIIDTVPDIRIFAATRGVFVVKLEPEILEANDTLLHVAKSNHLIKNTPVQPNASTVLLDLALPLDTVMTNLNQKGRHAINRARRDGVIIKRVEPTDENCQVFYNLLAATAAGSFRIRSPEYYSAFWKGFSHSDNESIKGQLFFAFVNETIVAGAYGLVYAQKSTYKDGASLRERPVYGASHMLQWELISWAKDSGALQHDLCGAPPSQHMKDVSHPHYGIGRFKTSFNKHITDYVGVYDLVVRPVRYKLWTLIGERLMQRLYTKIRNENFY